MKRALKAACVLFIASLVSGCAGVSDEDTVLVMAAASLTDAFHEIEVAFEEVNPTIDVQLNLAGSSALREQILEGAPADVFASANVDTMQQVVDEGEARSWNHFATNELVIAVPAGNPANVSSLADLANADLLVGLCSDGVPCGIFARQALAQAGVQAVPDTNEGDVRALLTKLEAGELDVGIVYATDVATSDKVESIPLPSDIAVPVVYPVAVLTEAPNESVAALFVSFVLSPVGQSILTANGFGPSTDTQTDFGCSELATPLPIAQCDGRE